MLAVGAVTSRTTKCKSKMCQTIALVPGKMHNMNMAYSKPLFHKASSPTVTKWQGSKANGYIKEL